MGKNYDSSRLPTASGQEALITCATSGTVYLRVPTKKQAHLNISSRNGKTTLTLNPGTAPTGKRGKQISSSLIVTTDGDAVEARTYSSGKVSLTLPGDWGLTWATLPREGDGETGTVYSLRKVA